MNDSPEPACGRAYESLLEIAAHELEDQAAAFDQVSNKECAGNTSHSFTTVAFFKKS
jgi:hypothetical protein